jgi:renalase
VERSRFRVAVVGAGVAGLSAAGRLLDAGLDVRVFEKSRGLGGRLAVRRQDGIGSFDLGAQFMTAESVAFRQVLAEASSRGLVAPWEGRLVHISAHGTESARSRTRYVGVPGMNAWVKSMVKQEFVNLGHQVAQVRQEADGRWSLDGARDSFFDAVVLAIPAPQAQALLGTKIPLADETSLLLAQETMEPCWCVYAAFDDRVDLPFDGAFVRDPGLPFSWIARDSSKPGRGTTRDHWVLHASPAWSRQHFDVDPKTVTDILLAALASLAGKALPPAAHVGSHRWRYAAPIGQGLSSPQWSGSQRIGVVGDWVSGGRVEGAYLAGVSMADAILDWWQKTCYRTL